MSLTPDFEMAKSFIFELTGDTDTPITLQTFDDYKPKKTKEGSAEDPKIKRPGSSLTRILHGTINSQKEELFDLSRKGAGIFLCPSVTDLKGRALKNVISARCLYVDKDDGLISTFKIEPNLIVKTARGAHYYWLLEEEISPEQFRPIAKAMINVYGTDKAIQQPNAVLRLPGFPHQKDPANPILITFEKRASKRYSLKELVAAHPAIKTGPSAGSEKTKSAPRGIILESYPIEPGSRNTSALGLIRSAIADGLEKSEVEVLCLEYIARCKTHAGYESDPFTDEAILSMLEIQWEHPEREKFYTTGSSSSCDYFVRDNSIFRRELRKDEWIDVKCSNFSAKIVAERTFDNGVEERKELAIRATAHDGEARIISVPAADFGTGTWIETKLGAKFIVEPTRREKLLAGIKKLSLGFEELKFYDHTGFREINGKRTFLMPDGSIDSDGFHAEPKSHFSDRSTPPYSFKGVLTEVDIPLANYYIWKFINVAPGDVMLPLLAAVFRAPLCSIKHSDVSIFLDGPSGSKKSTIAGLACAFTGPLFDRHRLQSNFTSTVNSIEATLFKFKDLVQVIDDFAPRGSSNDINKYQQIADRAFRNIGNGASRSRMTATGELRPNLPPRGQVLATGEDTPIGNSVQARLLVLTVGPESVNCKLLTEVQTLAAQGIASLIFGSYIQFLCLHWSTLRGTFPKLFEAYRKKYANLGRHSRFAENMANFAVSLRFFFQFCVSQKILSEKEIENIKLLWNDAVKKLAIRERSLSKESDVALQFIDLILGAFDSNQAFLANPKTAGRPKEPGIWGWQSDGEVRSGEISYREGKATKIGWVDDTYVYLLPKPSFQIAYDYAKSMGVNFAITESSLHRRLAQKNLLISPEADTFLTKVKAEKKRPRVLKFKKEVFGYRERILKETEAEGEPESDSTTSEEVSHVTH